MKIKFVYFFLLFLLGRTLTGCSDILDAKPQQSLLVPSKLSDFQALLDDFALMNYFVSGLSSVAVDDFYTTDGGWQSLQPIERNAYLWKEDVYDNQVDVSDWNTPYKVVFNTNIVLDGLSDLSLEAEHLDESRAIRARALFYRSFAYYALAQTFFPAFDSGESSNKQIVPVQLSSDVNEPANYRSLHELYQMLISDLMDAATSLDNLASIRARPSKMACYALLARIYLLLAEYEEAARYASLALEINSTLLDYNTIPLDTDRPFPNSHLNANEEVCFYAGMTSYSYHRAALTFVAPELYTLYEEDDLRKYILFKKGDEGVNLKGTYTGNSSRFAGITNAELLLIRAECNARLGNHEQTKIDLTTLLKKRYVTDTFSDSVIPDDDLLDFVLLERRKELVGRDTRWSDLKRLNLDSETATTLSRMIDGVEYHLPPNDDRYAFPIPQAEGHNPS